MPLRLIQQFIKLESASGIILMIMAVLALVINNSALSPFYDRLLNIHFAVLLGNTGIDKPVLLWINDGLMAVFFFLVGLELKREVKVGELDEVSKMILPGLAAIGGFVVPALVYSFVNQGDPDSMAGWAIPSATDIAFALGVLSLVGDRVPKSLKLFLMTLAVIDDLLAIVVIAIFYSGQLSAFHLGASAICIAALALMNYFGVKKTAPFILVGIVFWAMVLKSGVHATLAGVITALFIPLIPSESEESMLESLEHSLHPYVAFMILPIFGFANAGVSLAGLSFADLIAPVPMGIAAGLVIGKLIGVSGAVALARLFNIAPMPAGANSVHIIGVALLCGIGFTMSLFIAGLAFEAGGSHAIGTDRLGILMGSVMAAVLGYFVLRVLAKPVSESDG